MSASHGRAAARPLVNTRAPLARILLVADDAPAIRALLDAVRGRARGSARFHLLVHASAGDADLSEPERHRRYLDGESLLTSSLPLLTKAAGSPAEGSVSMRHDAAAAIEDTLAAGGYDEVIVAVPAPAVRGDVRLTTVAAPAG